MEAFAVELSLARTPPGGPDHGMNSAKSYVVFNGHSQVPALLHTGMQQQQKLHNKVAEFYRTIAHEKRIYSSNERALKTSVAIETAAGFQPITVAQC